LVHAPTLNFRDLHTINYTDHTVVSKNISVSRVLPWRKILLRAAFRPHSLAFSVHPRHSTPVEDFLPYRRHRSLEHRLVILTQYSTSNSKLLLLVVFCDISSGSTGQSTASSPDGTIWRPVSSKHTAPPSLAHSHAMSIRFALYTAMLAMSRTPLYTLLCGKSPSHLQWLQFHYVIVS